MGSAWKGLESGNGTIILPMEHPQGMVPKGLGKRKTLALWLTPFPRGCGPRYATCNASCGCSTCITEAGVPKHVQAALKAKWDQFTGKELQVKFLWIPKKTL